MADGDEKPKRAAAKQTRAEIDRIEDGDVAVLIIGDDRKKQVDVPASLLPEGAAEGDHLRISITLDRESRAAASTRVKRLQDKLAAKGGGGDEKDFKL